MYFPTISIGYAVPNEDFTASVHSAFRSALNLRLDGENNLLTLVVSSEGDLPQGIRLDAPESFSFEGFQTGASVTRKDGRLHFEKSPLMVELSRARRWKCDLPAVGRTGSPTYLPAAWSFVWETVNKRQRLSKSEILAEELFHESTQDGSARRAGEAIRDLLYAARQCDLNPSAVRALIGLGSGLTPSGDDLLVGYLAGLWCTVQHQNDRIQFVSDLGQTILPLLPQTNDISRTYLYHAVQGQVSSRLADLAEGITHGKQPERLREVSEAAMNIGHTSGMDAVTGLLLGLATWVKPGIPYF